MLSTASVKRESLLSLEFRTLAIFSMCKGVCLMLPELPDLNELPSPETEEQPHPEPVPQQPDRSRQLRRDRMRCLGYWEGEIAALKVKIADLKVKIADLEHNMEVSLRKERESSERQRLHHIHMENAFHQLWNRRRRQ